MREIKFRIWDTENKEMLKVQELDFEPTFYGGRIAIRPDQYSDYFDTEDMILMQYTGLKDKNGKEIYEGDIVRTHYIGGDGVENDEVIFDRGCFCVNYSEDYHPLLNEVNHCSEVIGNIYQNPELLERS